MNKKFSFVLLLLIVSLFLSSCSTLFHRHGAFFYKVATEPTCMEKGIREVYCGKCKELVKTEEIPATGDHLFGSPRSLKAPTCTDAGLVSRTCSLCGYTFEEPGLANGHSYSDVSVVFGSWGKDDKYYKVCVVCGDKVEISASEAKTRMDKLGKSL